MRRSYPTGHGIMQKQKKKLPAIFLYLFLLLSLSSCSGGGGGGGTAVGNNNTQTSSLTMSTAGALAPGTQIGGIRVMLTLPPGVTVKSTTNPPQTDAGVVVVSGIATGPNENLIAVYTAATNTKLGRISAQIVNANGFSAGQFATVSCTIASGYALKTSNFSVLDFAAVDLNGVAIQGLSLRLAADSTGNF
jgi:hypothetical protein